MTHYNYYTPVYIHNADFEWLHITEMYKLLLWLLLVSAYMYISNYECVCQYIYVYIIYTYYV